MHIDNIRPERAGSAGEIKRDAAEHAIRPLQPASPARSADRVEISQAGRDLSLQQLGAAGGKLSPERIAQLRERIAEGFYDRPDIIERVARGILDSGEIGRSGGGGET